MFQCFLTQSDPLPLDEVLFQLLIAGVLARCLAVVRLVYPVDCRSQLIMHRLQRKRSQLLQN